MLLLHLTFFGRLLLYIIMEFRRILSTSENILQIVCYSMDNIVVFSVKIAGISCCQRCILYRVKQKGKGGLE